MTLLLELVVGFVLGAIFMRFYKRRLTPCRCFHERKRGRFEWDCPYHGHVNIQDARWQLIVKGKL